MAGFNYERSAQTAKRLIEKFGRVVPYQVSTPGDGPAHNPGPEVWSDPVDVLVAVLPANKGPLTSFDNQLVGGTLIEEQLRYCYLSPLLANGSPLPFEAKALDRMRFDGYYWEVLGATPLNPGGVTVYYTMGVKRQ